MSTDVTVEYLDEERRKLWERLERLEKQGSVIDELRNELAQKCSKEDLKSVESDFDRKLPEYERDARSASKMISQYRNKCKNHADEMEAACGRITDYDTQLSVLVNTFETLKASQEEATGLLEQVNRAMQCVTQKKTEAEGLIKAVQTLQTEASQKVEEMEESREAWQEIETENLKPAKMRIEALRENTEKDASEIRKTYETIFGSSGLKDKLEKAFETLQKNFVAHQRESKKEFSDNKVAVEELSKEATERYEALLKDKEETYMRLKTQIEGLLPAALTAGLASAYQEKREHEEEERSGSQKTFLLAIWGMVIFALIPVAFNVWLFISKAKTIDEIIANLPFTVTLIIPLYAPILWLAYSANKRVNQSKRLIEEYAHKEALSKTFEGLSTQIKKLEASGLSGDLSIKLLYSVIKASSENPGELIKGFNKPDNPLLDVLEKTTSLSDSFSKLAEIPGMAWIANMLKTRQQTKSEKAKKTLEQHISEATSLDDSEK